MSGCEYLEVMTRRMTASASGMVCREGGREISGLSENLAVLCLPYPEWQHRRGEEALEQLEREPVRLFGPRADLEPGHEQERADSADRPDEDMPREELAQPTEFEVAERGEREAGQHGRHGKGKHGRGDERLVVADVVLQCPDNGVVEGNDFDHHRAVAAVKDGTAA